MDALRTLKVQKIKHGIPLYRAVSDALREAIGVMIEVMLDVNIYEYRPALRESIAHQAKEA